MGAENAEGVSWNVAASGRSAFRGQLPEIDLKLFRKAAKASLKR